jgi:multidrug efflux pump subunit AcrB
MTTVTTICGMIPLTFLGGPLWRPMGAVIIFGLLVSTLLTLVVIPLGCVSAGRHLVRH